MSTGPTLGNGAALPSTDNVNSKPKTSLAWSLSVTEKCVREGGETDAKPIGTKTVTDNQNVKKIVVRSEAERPGFY